MKDEVLKDNVTELLKVWGFEVEQLQERAMVRTPDLVATKAGQRFIIELKTKGRDARRLAKEAARMAQGEIVEHGELAGRRGTQAGIIADGVKQILALPPLEADFLTIWIHLEGDDPAFQMEQFRGAAYGVSNVIDLDGAPTRECYYFYNSDFHRYREALDGIILSRSESTEAKAQLLVNNLSPRAGRFLSSMLARQFAGAVIDPTRLERAGTIYIADCDADRKMLGGVVAYLQEKYGRARLCNIDMGKCEMKVALSSDEE